MVVGSGIEGAGGAALLYRSSDLRRWTYMGPLLTGQAHMTGIMWECPNFFPLGGKHVLAVSPYGRVTYFIGSYTAGRLLPEQTGLMDLGDAYYATNCLLDEGNRRTMWGWIREQRSEEAQTAAGWSGVMSLPRIVSLGADGQLCQEPAVELRMLRSKHWGCRDIALKPDSPVLVPATEGDSLEIVVEFEPSTASAVGLKLCRSPQGAEETLLLYDRERRLLTADRSRSSLSPAVGRTLQGGTFEPPADEPLSFHVFLDRSVVEAFVNRRTCLTTRVYPTRDDSVGLCAFATAGHARVSSLDVWEMASIWP